MLYQIHSFSLYYSLLRLHELTKVHCYKNIINKVNGNEAKWLDVEKRTSVI